jgi:UDP-N-acetylglucosamine 4-epimerase
LSAYDTLHTSLPRDPRSWLVTGGAGFIGSHLCEALLRLEQRVAVLDNFETGKRENLADVVRSVGPERAARLTVHDGDLRDLAACHTACAGTDYVLHQAALGSVPRSIADPIRSHEANVSGFLNMLVAARDAGVKRMVYASSSSVYGDHTGLPKFEEHIGRPLSPYATTKLVDELYARNFHDLYGFEAVGLRYFNVFGPRQDPEGAYAAVIPRWIGAIRRGEECRINGDGETSRDFCYIDNTVQANLLAATAEGPGVSGEAFNVACEGRTTLNQIYALLRERVARVSPGLVTRAATYGPERAGDVRHSLANVDRARTRLGYEPTVDVAEGLTRTVAWFLAGRSG